MQAISLSIMDATDGRNVVRVTSQPGRGFDPS